MASVTQEMKFIRARKREIMRKFDGECERLLRSGGVYREDAACTKIVIHVALSNLSEWFQPLHADHKKAAKNLKLF
jgi:hypothetical protein